MTPLLANWTIVLVGKWNVDILNPDWVAREVFSSDSIDIEMVMDGGGTFVKYVHNGISFLPRSDRVVISVSNTDPAFLTRAEATSGILLKLLPVTPMAAVGINFTFIENEPTTKLLRAISLKDNADISDLGFEIEGTQVSRAIKYEDRSLNLNITQDQTGSVRVGANFHLLVGSAEEAANGVLDKVNHLKAGCLDFLWKIYDLECKDASQ